MGEKSPGGRAAKSPAGGAFAAALIVIGLAWLLVKGGILTSGQAFGVLRLWPLFLIIVGLEMFMRGRGRPCPFVVGPALVFVGALVVWFVPGVGTGVGPGSDVKGNLSVAAAVAGDDELRVELSVGALELQLQGADQAELTVDYAGVEPRITEGDGSVDIEARQSRLGSCGRMGGYDARWNVRIPSGRPVDLRVDAGAAEIVADLSAVDLARLDIRAGAADIHVLLPSRPGETTVEFDTGASEILLEVPGDVAVKLDSDSALSDTRFTGLELVNRGDCLATPDFDKAARRIVIELDAAVSDITIRRR